MKCASKRHVLTLRSLCMPQRAFFEAVTVFPALVCNKASLTYSRKTSSVLSFLLRAGLLQKLEMTEPEETPAGERKHGFLPLGSMHSFLLFR